ncbi:histidinol-phosphatase HisJ family protein [Acetivibrio mesophilus]|uniref:Histidinol-phosphatase n=1 Tax=Acetivibrio mesophilus TaxID=2487273 RepID=A0A4V1K1X8_9FIRM|nr:histidinol-phosphatase HisJ family protein [Acetivibrio mesophilus]ODM25432.1 histidinol phosphate phosphatase [Clostridium sp. Bc-iso-3]RXE58339.1 histidinol-phosphatase HisJ family protein [Acetivibrio mesophilus]HHV28896.1 histidinol-phosphatase HisJ family protein [Clostridium sp.]
MYDCHVHSSFSGDSNMDAEIAINTAEKFGLEGISFTDHLDIDYPDYDDVFTIDFDKYSEVMDRLKRDYSAKIRVFKGIEVGIQPHVIEESNDIVKKYDFDIVIGSIHIVDKTDLHNGDFCRNKTKNEAYLRYLETVLECINLFDNFDILGHIDLIRRYGCYDDRTLKLSDFGDWIDAILKALISNGKGIEVNTSGFRYNLNSPMPDYEIIKRYRELNGEIICTSSDAHTPEYIGYKFDYVKELLLKAGFRYTAHFENRKPVFTPI